MSTLYLSPSRLFSPLFASLFIVTITAFMPTQARASLSSDLQSLVVEGDALNTQLATIAITEGSACVELNAALGSVQAFTSSINTASSNLVTPILLDANILSDMDNLNLISANIASVLPILSADLTTLSYSSELADIQGALDTLLQLSSEIGVMADRILEMADKILLMADNIGDMADRILLTQQIQSSNMTMTQAFLLSTQENTVILTPSIDTSSYNLPLNNLVTTGQALSVDMNNTPLTESNMNSVLAEFESRVSVYLDSTMLLYTLQSADSAFSSFAINSDTLTLLGDLTLINAALAEALNRYAQAINTLAPNTDITVLNAAVYSMLRLAADIGLMANRIVEMGDKIGIMADNIGFMTLRIDETQTLQQSNLVLTQNNLTSAQTTSLSVIATYGL